MTRSGYFLDLVVSFVFGWAAVAEGAMQSGAVVPADVLDDRVPCGGLGRPGLQVEQLAFDGGEERFGQGVVPALAGAAVGQHGVGLAGGGGGGGGGVLAGPVGVKDHARARVAGRDRVGQRIGDQLGAQVISDGVADDPAGGDVDHGGQVQPPLPGADVGDVPAPARVDRGGIGGEVAAD